MLLPLRNSIVQKLSGSLLCFFISAICTTGSGLLFYTIFTFVFPEWCKWFGCRWGGGKRKGAWYQWCEWTSQKEGSPEVMMYLTVHHFMAVTGWHVHFLCKPRSCTLLPVRDDATERAVCYVRNIWSTIYHNLVSEFGICVFLCWISATYV